jgi:hypothetical protein
MWATSAVGHSAVLSCVDLQWATAAVQACMRAIQSGPPVAFVLSYASAAALIADLAAILQAPADPSKTNLST